VGVVGGGGGGGGGGGLAGAGTPRKVGWEARSASPHPYPIYVQNLRFLLPYLRPLRLAQLPCT